MSVARVLPRREDPNQQSDRRVAGRTSLTTLLRVLPPGSRPARSQGSWIRTVEAHLDLAPLRADAQHNLRTLAWELARWADWHTPITRPTWQRLGAAAGLSRSTVAKWLAWLRDRELLAIVEHGTTPQFRPGVLIGSTEGNLASVYLLCEPSFGDEPDESIKEHRHPIFIVDETQTPPWKLSTPHRQNARAHATPPLPHGSETPTPRSAPPPRRPVDDVADIARPSNHKNAPTNAARDTKVGSPWRLWQTARTKPERLTLCERLQHESPPLRAAGSTRQLRHLLRPWLLAGWTARGLLYAIEHTPDGAPWPYAWRSVRELRNPAGWLLHRLRAWRDRHGQVLSDPIAVTGGKQNRVYAAATPHPSPILPTPEQVRSITATIHARLRERPRSHS